MVYKKIFLITLVFLLTINNVFAFSNCQLKYDNDKRALTSLKGKCSVCHINPSGAGPVNAFGKAFADVGFKITDELVAKFPDFFQKPKEESKPTPTPFATPSPATSEVQPNILSPSIKRIKPKNLKTGIQSMVTIIGKNFVTESKAFVDNNEVLTTFKSNLRLLIDFVLDTVGLYEVKVKNPDGQESNAVKVRAK